MNDSADSAYIMVDKENLEKSSSISTSEESATAPSAILPY